MFYNKSLKVTLLLLIILALALPAGFSEALEGHSTYFSTQENSPEIAEARLSFEIKEALQDLKDDEKIEVLIVLKEQTDTASIAAQAQRNMLASLTPHQEKVLTRFAVVDALQEAANRTQQPLLSLLAREQDRYNVEEFKSFYIVNIIYARLTAELLYEISEHPEVDQILPNSKIELIEPVTELEDMVFGLGELDSNLDFSTSESSNIEWNIDHIDAPAVWDEYNFDGTGVVIGVIDTGVMSNHKALKNKWRGYNPEDPNSPDPIYNWFDAIGDLELPYDWNSHGTFVTGIILGTEADDQNQVGAAPGAQWIAARAFDEDGFSTFAWLLAAGEYMLAPTDANGVPKPAMAPDIINNSWGGGSDTNQWYRDMVQAWRSAGILSVFSAGNRGSNDIATGPPGNYPESFAVAATDRYDNLAIFSSRGPAPYDHPNDMKPNISAPGVNIRSSCAGMDYGSNLWGTSFAAPHVTGVAALLLSADATLSVDQIEELIIHSANPLIDSYYLSSPNYGYGYGLVNAFNAISFLKEGYGKITGQVLSEANGGMPINAVITVPETGHSVHTNPSDGTFTLYHLAGQNWTLQVESYGYYPLQQPFDLDNEENLNLEELFLQAIPTGTLSGSVVNQGSIDHVEGARIYLLNDPNLPEVYTDSEGNFQIDNIHEGEYVLHASAGNYHSKQILTSVTGSSITEVLVELPPFNLEVNFNTDITTGYVPQDIQFSDDTSGEPTGWAWYFGDESFSEAWIQITKDAGWGGRVYDSVVLGDGSIVLIGGHDGDYKNIVWRSTDNGGSWIRMAENPEWSYRILEASVNTVALADGSILLMGGRALTAMGDDGWITYSPNLNDVWRSDDHGATWTQVNENADWAGRSGHSIVALSDDSIVLMGGFVGGSGKQNDVWRSTDGGVTWVQMTSNADWTSRSSHSTVVLKDDSILLTGGYDFDYERKNDVWRSTDHGATWTQVNENADWAPRTDHSSVVLPDGSIVIMGGADNRENNNRRNDIWRSTDHGATWTQVNENADWTKRCSFSSVVLPDGSIVIMGGLDDVTGEQNDVWRLETAGSTKQHPLHTYTEPGSYQVALQAYNASEYQGIQKTDDIHIFVALPITTYAVTFGVAAGEGAIAAVTNSATLSSGAQVEEASQITFTATPDTGQRVKDWIIDGSSIGSTALTYTVDNLQDDLDVKVEFETIPPATYSLGLSASPTTGGSATDLTATGPYIAGAKVNIKAEAVEGYEFSGWSASAGTFANASATETTFTMPAQNVTVTANFTEVTKLGDVSGDGDVDVTDVVLAMRFSLEIETPTEKQKAAADVNGDGEVDVNDVVLIMRYALGLIDIFPAGKIEQ